ncbi:hypothetical protein INS49_015687 [Diaporthe citri]|uniref:uncharacterized protein n=1 Tax=Diaporthe citri TaxID=83186 RepID=UPI001C7E6872|nr:uncharacterized protein INS49_015687 [Diaporthe citri]KAG6356300.1 hypothetical protein INS49_015687 [Diaporthe citri]
MAIQGHPDEDGVVEGMPNTFDDLTHAELNSRIPDASTAMENHLWSAMCNPKPPSYELCTAKKRGGKLASPGLPKPTQGSRAGELENQAAFRARATLAVTHRPQRAKPSAKLDWTPSRRWRSKV